MRGETASVPGRSVLDISDSGKWIPYSAMMNDGDINSPTMIAQYPGMVAKDLLYDQVWDAGKKLKHTLSLQEVGDGNEGVSTSYTAPNSLYGDDFDLDACMQCQQNSTKKKLLPRCERWHMVSYCSKQCQSRDWKVHKALCGYPRYLPGHQARMQEILGPNYVSVEV